MEKKNETAELVHKPHLPAYPICAKRLGGSPLPL